MNTEIQNTKECFVQLWQQLERTRQLFGMQYRRFCIRRLMHSWLGDEATDMMIWEVCQLSATHECDHVNGLDIIPPPALYPRRSREFLRALVAVKLGIGIRKVDLKALDRAYSIAFPHSTPINVNKKRRVPHPGGVTEQWLVVSV